MHGYNAVMKKAILFVVVPLAILVASLWAVPFLLPTVLPRPTMTKAERIEADQAAIAIAAEMARKQRQRKEQEAAFNKLLDSIPVAEPETKPDAEPTPVKRFATVEAYFSDGNPNPLSHRRGLPNYERDVSEKTKREVKKRDGNCCLVCGSAYQLEVDHRIARMNGGDNSKKNLGTLCDSCHNKKTRLDYKIRKQRRKEAGKR